MSADRLVFIVVMCCFAVGISVAKADTTYIQPTNEYGKVLYGKPGLAIKDDGMIYKTNQYGKILYNEPQYKIQDNKLYDVNEYGRSIKPSKEILK